MPNFFSYDANIFENGGVNFGNERNRFGEVSYSASRIDGPTLQAQNGGVAVTPAVNDVFFMMKLPLNRSIINIGASYFSLNVLGANTCNIRLLLAVAQNNNLSQPLIANANQYIVLHNIAVSNTAAPVSYRSNSLLSIPLAQHAGETIFLDRIFHGTVLYTIFQNYLQVADRPQLGLTHFCGLYAMITTANFAAAWNANTCLTVNCLTQSVGASVGNLQETI
jgi:hypothetical protein